MRWIIPTENSVESLALSRRDFLRVAGGAGLLISIKLGGIARAERSGAAAAMQGNGEETIDATGFVKIAPDNTVTVVVKHLEMGQGPYTGIATLVAEELDADWSQMRAEAAPANVALYKNLAFGIQGTGGSTAIANSYEQMRKAGATARAMLVAAAAEAWSVSAGEITVEKGIVKHAGSSKQASFGELTEQAAQITPPKDVKLKDPKQFTLIGTTVPRRLDSAVKSEGEAIFTIDTNRPEALTVVVAHPPRFGAKAATVDDSAARQVRGVVDVRTIPQGVAVYAKGFWAAKKGRDALKISWDESGTEARGTDQLLADFRKQAQQPGSKAGGRGDVTSTLGKGGKTFEAEYIFPYLAHAPMEPLDCAIEIKQGACEAWFGSQLQTVDHKVIATIMGLPDEKVAVNTLFAGGSFGRRAQATGDFAAEAAAALKALGSDGRSNWCGRAKTISGAGATGRLRCINCAAVSIGAATSSRGTRPSSASRF
jgi:isoquinoline 1-oxidoreductase beta subunit